MLLKVLVWVFAPVPVLVFVQEPKVRQLSRAQRALALALSVVQQVVELFGRVGLVGLVWAQATFRQDCAPRFGAHALVSQQAVWA